MSTAGETFEKGNLERLPLWRVGIYGLGNFASNLSWMMVSTYLAIFCTDVIGLSAASVATMLLITRIWDAANDPMMGLIGERTRSKWGRFRPYLLFCPPLLAVCTILTFRNPGFSQNGNLIYMYIFYTALTMIYTATNVPYASLALAITRHRDDPPRLGAAWGTGMNVAMILLNMITLPLITMLGKGDMSRGYQTTATIYAISAVFLFWIVFAGTKEVITFTKKSDIPLLRSFQVIFKDRNTMCVIVHNTLAMIGLMGRISIAVYFYLHVVKRLDLVGLFMSLEMIVGIVIAPFAPLLARKMGRKHSIILGYVLKTVGLMMIFLGDVTNIPYLIVSHIIFGMGFLGTINDVTLNRDAVDAVEYKTGVRIDGTFSGFYGFATKTGGAIGTSIGLFVMGLSGYIGGQEITPQIATGINRSVNMVPLICMGLAIIPLLFYNLSEKETKEIQKELEARRDAENSETA
jgi:sugar (glycoside-pentoside-hexuronide) transporter